MAYSMFHQYCPEVGMQETRSITVPPDSGLGLPAGDYAFLEMYCDERGCDCRRVFFNIMSRQREKAEAVIAWGWENVEFYAKWYKYGDAADAAELKGPALNPGSPATELAPALLEVVRNILLKDPEYVERIKRHYQMFKDKVDQPPILRRMRGLVKPKKRKTRKRR